MVRAGVGMHRGSGGADAFALSRPAGLRAVFLAQQFYGLAIDVCDEPLDAGLAGGDADAGPVGQFARCFTPAYQ